MIIHEGGKLVWDNAYRVVLRSYHDTLKSQVDIECRDYTIFKEIVDAVQPILDKEEEQYKSED